MRFDSHSNACKAGPFDSLTSRLYQSDDPEIAKRERELSFIWGKFLGYGTTDLYSLRPIKPNVEGQWEIKT